MSHTYLLKRNAHHTLKKSLREIRNEINQKSFKRIEKLRPWYEQNKLILMSGPKYIAAKRVMDVVLSLFLILLVLPVLVLCAIIIRLDSRGPILYVQERTGYAGRRFKMFKLRTMHKNAEELKEKYMHLNTLSYPDFKIPDDPRITRIGKFFRKTSLDELPQIFNVLKGDMSLIGPRPTSFHSSSYDLWHTVRLEIKPGVTGLWQVSGRSDIEFDERIRLDYAYMKNVSLGLDIKILLRTFSSVVNREGA